MKSKRIMSTLGLTILMGLVMMQGAAFAGKEELSVLTRNLYLGADLTPAMAAQNETEFVTAVSGILGTIALNNFPERAEALASEIAEKMPHLVGLQEVYNFTFNGSNGTPPFRDHLQDLMEALQARGATYRVAGVVNNMNLQLPFGGNLVGVLDRDVILARKDVATEVVDFGTACKTSLEGCNYHVVATIPNPLDPTSPPIIVERGFVGVTARLPEGQQTTFVNTHLEVREVGPYGLLQALQAQELVAFLDNLDVSVIVVGDLNSDPRDPVQNFIIPPYAQLTDAGYFDAWLEHRQSGPDGFTCCQNENLFNAQSELYERIDLIFTGEKPDKVKVELLGQHVSDKTGTSGLWPSDHAGVAARLTLKDQPRKHRKPQKHSGDYHQHH
jgi:endonuclease/exonuclease/phosphatase family metal-dependent hydrolase